MNEVCKVDFHGNEITVIEKDEQQYVAMKPIVEAMGLIWNKQLELIKRDPVLNKGVTVMGIPSVGGIQEMVCLPLNKLNGWLFKINAGRYTGKRQEAIMRYQEECYDVLFDYFHNGGAVNPRATDAQLQALIVTVQEEAYRRAVAELENKQLRRAIEGLAKFAVPDSAFGEMSRVTGLPRDIIVKAYHKSDKRKHAPQVKRHIQLVLNLYLNGDRLIHE